MINFRKGVVKLRISDFDSEYYFALPSSTRIFSHTRVNYDILTYLPKEIDTMKGQDILLDEFGTGAFSMCVVEGMEDQDISKMRKNMEKVDHVKKILWYDSLADLSIPKTMLPDKVQDAFINEDKDATLMVIFFDSSMSSDETMNAIEELRSVADKQCYISGMSAVVTDTKNLSDKRGTDLCTHRSNPCSHRTFTDYGLCIDPGILLIKYRNGNYIQLRFECVLRRDLPMSHRHLRRYYSSVLRWTIPFSCGILMKRTRSVSRMIRRERWLMQFRTP